MLKEQGIVWLVGAGPGDPGLITLRGREVLSRADVVLYDALSHPALLQFARKDAELRDVGKRGGRLSPDQNWITEQLIVCAREGKRVVRLKGGDSYLFARGAEEAEALQAAGVAFEVVPGLSSPVGTSAYAGIPLTHRDLSSSVTFITGSDKSGEEWSDDAWRKLATATDTLCILMGMRRIREIAAALIDGGRAPTTPVAVIQWGARPAQRVLTTELVNLADAVATAGLGNPAVIIVGEVVRLREQLNWFESLPLFGQKILVPRAEHQAADTAAQLRELGAEPILFPVIEVVAAPEPERLCRAVAEATSYDWVLFTSSNGVDRFFEEVQRQGRDARVLGQSRVGVIGPKTALALKRYGIVPDVVAKEFVGEGLAQEVMAQGGGTRVLIPRALRAREALPELLAAHGYQVDVVPAYETRQLSTERASQLRQMLEGGEVDWILFTSSSTVESTASALAVSGVAISELGEAASKVLGQVKLASIGPVTTATAKALGLPICITAEEYTVPGLLRALAAYSERA